MSELEHEVLAASEKWSNEFGRVVSFDLTSRGYIHASVGGIYVGTWNSLHGAETGVARLWMTQ